MFLSRIYSLLLVTSLSSSPLASAQALRKPISSQDETTHKTKDSFLSRVLGKISNKSDRHLQASIHYSQMGTDIDGNADDESHGKATAMSKDGSRVAIGAPGVSAAGSIIIKPGIVQVFDWNATLEEWVQVGQDIVGTNDFGNFGHSIDSNEDMSRIVVGAPAAHDDGGCVQVYELDSATNTWQQVGPDLPVNIADAGHAGVSVTMNAVGDRVAFGSPRQNTNAGQVTAFEYSNGAWNSLGQVIDGSTFYYGYYGAYTGGSIAMDASGNRMVVGSRLSDWWYGGVDVYDFDGNAWVSTHKELGDYYYDRFGGDVDISEDGTRIIVGAFTADDGNAQQKGRVEVFEEVGSDWVAIGQSIHGLEAFDKMGKSVIISGDGSHIAFSSPENDGDVLYSNIGIVHVMKYSAATSSWESLDILEGECAKDKFGDSHGAIAMDRTGTFVSIGSSFGNSYYGMTRIFEALPGPGDGANGSTNNCP